MFGGDSQIRTGSLYNTNVAPRLLAYTWWRYRELNPGLGPALLVEIAGFEPAAFAMRMRRSTS